MSYPPNAPLAYKVDHVGLSLAQAAAAFSFCRDELGLPVAWPFGKYGTASTGGIGLGNVNLEFLDAASVPLKVHEPAAVGLIAFQRAPATVETLAEALDERGVGHRGSVTTGDEVFGFTNVGLPPLGVDMSFFCGYHYPGAHDNALRLAALDAADGGILGLRGVTELRVAVDPAAWAPILAEPTSGRWRFDTGPDLAVDSSIAPGTAQMVWSVREVQHAVRALSRAGAEWTGQVASLPAIGGLHIAVTEEPAVRSADLADRRGRANR